MAPNTNKSQADSAAETQPAVVPHTKYQRHVLPLPDLDFKEEIVWKNVIRIGILHAFFPVAFFLFVARIKILTMVFTGVIAACAGLGVTAGAHRLWSHRSYKAKLPLRILLAIFNCIACQNHIYEWSRDHRVHHKYSETNADPHNVNRGFFFAHVGWLLLKKHPDVMNKGKAISLQDLLDDPVVWWQRKLYFPLALFFAFLMPTMVPYFFWGESAWYSFVVCAIGRYCLVLNATWLVNSAAHTWGNKPYDSKISARQNRFVTVGALGEGFHNYHHTFPMDYGTSEFGWKLNITTIFIDIMAALGQVYDRKVVPVSVIQKTASKNGFSTSSAHSHHEEVSEDSYTTKST